MRSRKLRKNPKDSSARSDGMILAVAFKPRIPIKIILRRVSDGLKSSPQVSFVVFNTILAKKLQVLLLKKLFLQ
jgi:hypothetical protein